MNMRNLSDVRVTLYSIKEHLVNLIAENDYSDYKYIAEFLEDIDLCNISQKLYKCAQQNNNLLSSDLINKKTLKQNQDSIKEVDGLLERVRIDKDSLKLNVLISCRLDKKILLLS